MPTTGVMLLGLAGTLVLGGVGLLYALVKLSERAARAELEAEKNAEALKRQNETASAVIEHKTIEDVEKDLTDGRF